MRSGTQWPSAELHEQHFCKVNSVANLNFKSKILIFRKFSKFLNLNLNAYIDELLEAYAPANHMMHPCVTAPAAQLRWKSITEGL